MKFIYRFIRTDGEEIDMGPFISKPVAQKASDFHKTFGAVITGIVEVSDNYKPYFGTERENVKNHT